MRNFPSVRRKAPTVAIGVLWLSAVMTGILVLANYANTPGRAGSPPPKWPAASELKRDPRQPTLLMFLHPQCPCSRASVGELSILMASSQGRVKATAVFLQPKGYDADWVHSDTWKEASKISGVTAVLDKEGREARLFNLQTSGDTVLYDAKGSLIFHGGITISRGHVGDNPGRAAVQAVLLGGAPTVTNTPAFGCPLFNCPFPGKPTST
jgi:hypothetical protein